MAQRTGTVGQRAEEIFHVASSLGNGQQQVQQIARALNVAGVDRGDMTVTMLVAQPLDHSATSVANPAILLGDAEMISGKEKPHGDVHQRKSTCCRMNGMKTCLAVQSRKISRR